jgi:hypothetical protein
MRGPLAMVGRNPTVGQGNYDSDANAAYQCAIMWCITGDIAYANKSKEIINAWSATLKSITGRDAVLMAGLGPFKMVNAAEIIRYTDAGWPEAEIQQAERHFRKVVYPVIKDFAPFANGNWDTAAIKTMMAIGVFCNDRGLFERALRYYVNGGGDGRLTYYIINETGQCQESGRDQGHTQLGLAHLGDCCEIAWHQGLNLYGYADNRLLKGFEYTAKYNLGEDVPFTETLDRTGKYHHSMISTNGRGRLRPVYEEIYNHYANRMGIAAPYTQRAAERIRPEGPGFPGADHPGFGTLLYSRPPEKMTRERVNRPLAPGAIIAQSFPAGNKLTWVASVGATSYTVKRSLTSGGPYTVIANDVASSTYTDSKIEAGKVYYYVVSAANSAGESPDAFETGISAGLPALWKQRDVGQPAVAGQSSFDGRRFTMEGAGADIGGMNDQFQFACVPMNGDGVIMARYVPQVSSQFTKMGLMMRETLTAGSAQVSLLLGPEPGQQVEAPGWIVRLLARDAAGANATVRGISPNFSEPIVTNGRLTGGCWLKLERSGNTFTGSISSDGQTWTQVGAATNSLQNGLLAGVSVCSRLTKVTTLVLFDNVTILAKKRE